LPLVFFTASDSSKNPGANGFGGEKSMSLYAGIEHVTALWPGLKHEMVALFASSKVGAF